MSLRDYRKMRDFAKTAEPRGGKRAAARARRFVVQEHDATQLHYDFRLEHDGVLKSWAVPKGPSLDPSVKRLAVQVEDHPIEYGGFEGVIPKGEYGGGTVMLWDRGTWEPEASNADVGRALRAGRMKFQLHGARLKGGWFLVRTRYDKGGKKPSWLLMKERDRYAKTGEAEGVTARYARSVTTRRTMKGIAG